MSSEPSDTTGTRETGKWKTQKKKKSKRNVKYLEFTELFIHGDIHRITRLNVISFCDDLYVVSWLG